MELRNHRRMTYLGRRSWPPEWKGPYGPGNPLPSGEVGILTRVEPAPADLQMPHCTLVIQWKEQEYIGSLYFDDEAFLQEILRLLRACPGQPISEIGSLDIP